MSEICLQIPRCAATLRPLIVGKIRNAVAGGRFKQGPLPRPGAWRFNTKA